MSLISAGFCVLSLINIIIVTSEVYCDKSLLLPKWLFLTFCMFGIKRRYHDIDFHLEYMCCNDGLRLGTPNYYHIPEQSEGSNLVPIELLRLWVRACMQKVLI